jgi:hypothetical protein
MQTTFLWTSSARLLALVTIMLLTACGSTRANDLTRPARPGAPILFRSAPQPAGARAKVRSSVMVEIDSPKHHDRVFARAGIEAEFDWTVLSRAGTDSRARLDVRVWHKWSSRGSTRPVVMPGSSYVLERVGGALRISSGAGQSLSAEEQRVVADEHQNFGLMASHERVLAGRRLRAGDTVPIADIKNGTVLEGNLRLLGMTHFGDRSVAEFEFRGKMSKLEADTHFGGDVAGVVLIDPADTSLVMLDLQGPVWVRQGERAVGGRCKILSTSVRI